MFTSVNVLSFLHCCIFLSFFFAMPLLMMSLQSVISTNFFLLFFFLLIIQRQRRWLDHVRLRADFSLSVCTFVLFLEQVFFGGLLWVFLEGKGILLTQNQY